MERSSKCAVCYSSFRASICVACVNRSLHECKTVLDSLKSRREVSYSRLSSLLVAKVWLFCSLKSFKVFDLRLI